MSSMDEDTELRNEVDRLNGLAQLGITVEIVGHELQDYDDIISAGLAALPDDVRDTKAVRDIRFAVDGLTEQLRFLSPLKLSGQKISKWITGQELFEYVKEFLGNRLSRGDITITATDEFLAFRVYDQPSRLYPVFINIINNSAYWLGTSSYRDRKIELGVRKGQIVIADNGPGIDEYDVKSLFTLFFTRKLRGGRGVGLYLSRANLAAGGHRIHYVTDDAEKLLDGANFAIEFRGAEFNEH